MMRKNVLVRMMAVTCVILMLSACGSKATEFETVSDTVTPVMQQQRVYSILVSLPDDVVEQTFSDDGLLHVYEQKDGAYEVVTQVMYETGIEQVLRDLTGRDSETLTVLKTDRCGLPEYRTTWYTESEEGGKIHRASVLFDGLICYCLSYSVAENQAEQMQACMEGIFASLSLHSEES